MVQSRFFKYYAYLWLVILSALFAVSCENNKYYEGNDVQLRFSTDTITFDTIFTTLGSTTLNFRIYNEFNQPINIDNVSLGSGGTSPFRINVDGYLGSSIDNIKIYANDSAYVFVEVTIDPTNSNLPLFIKDSIVFTINNKKQYVRLLAYGQDAIHLKAHPDSNYISLSNTVFTKDKPYLIHDHLFVKEDAILTIEAGAKLFFRKERSLFVQGTLQVKGTLDEPVLFRGDRLDEVYDGLSYNQVPGQWGYIHLFAGSKNNEINYANIRNSIIGIEVDSVVTPDAPSLLIRNSIIDNCTSIGLYALGAHVIAENCVFSNCGQVAVALVIGGKYDFTHCTIGNYYDWTSGRQEPAMYVSNFYTDIYDRVIGRDLNQADFKNCIIYGRNADELLLEDEVAGEKVFAAFNYSFDYCLIKTHSYIDTLDAPGFTNILWNKDPKFIDPFSTETANFQLDSLSPAINAGLEAYGNSFPVDLMGVSRLDDEAPDLGAYEKVYPAKVE